MHIGLSEARASALLAVVSARARMVVAFGCSLSMLKITSARKSTGGGGVASGEAAPLGEPRDSLDDGGGDGIIYPLRLGEGCFFEL